MKLFFFLISFMVISFSLFAQEVSHYHIEAQFNPLKHSISGTLTLSYFNGEDESISTISLMLLANLKKESNEMLSRVVEDLGFRYGFESSFTKVYRVSSNPTNDLEFQIRKGFEFLQDYSNDAAILDVFLDEPLAPGERFTIRIQFETKFAEEKSDLGYYEDVYNARFGWFPQELPIREGKAHESLMFHPFTYSLKITMPKDYILAHIGDEFNEEIIKDEILYSVTSENPVRTIPLSFSKKFKVFSKKIGDILVNVYGPGDSPWILHGNHNDDAEFLFTKVLRIVRFYETLYGPLSSGSISFTIHYGHNIFYASDGLISIAESYFLKDLASPGLKDRIFEYIIAHEIAHLYWGISVSNDFYFDDWIAEGLAEYSSISYIEHTYGVRDNFFKLRPLFYLIVYLLQAYDPFVLYYPENVDDVYFLNYRRFVLDGIDQPIQKQPFFKGDRTNFDFVRTYMKSYLILKSLSEYLGTDEFNRILKLIYRKEKAEFLTTKEFEKTIKEHTDKEVTRFFSDWVYNNYNIDYEVVDVTAKSVGDSIRNEIKIKRHGKAFLPFHVKIHFQDKTTAYLFIEKENDVFIISIDSGAKIEQVEIDPGYELPDFNRQNNFYPRKPIKWSLLFEYPTDRYNINIAPYIFGGYGVRINGHFLDDHYWTLLASYTGDFVQFYERFAYRLARAQYFDITLNQVVSTDSAREWFLINEAGYSFTLFEKNKLGFTRFTDIPANNFRIATGFNYFKELDASTTIGENTKADLPDVIEYFRLNYTRNDIVIFGMLNEFEAFYTEFSRFVMRTSRLDKITNYINSYGFIEFGYNTDHTIEFYKFDFDQLYLFDDVSPSLRRVLGSFEISHALLRTKRTRYFGIFENSLSFLNSVVFEGITIGALARAGYLWDNDFGSNEIHGSYGPFVEILNRTFFDVEFNVRVGSVFPINKRATTDDYKVFVEAYAAF